MKTINITIAQPQLEITYTCDSDSPREWSNVSLLILKGFYGDNEEYLNKALIQTGNIARSAEHHLKLMIKEVERDFGKVVFSDFITKYEHGGVKLYRGNGSGFDYAMIGFVFVTEQHLEEMGIESDMERIKEYVDCEIETYNQWINGEVFQYTLYDENGEIQDCCTGFYELESIKDHLPKEWQNENLEHYIKYN